MLIELLGSPLAVDKEYAARLYVVYHLVSLDYIGRVMAGNEVSLVDVVGALNRLVAKAQVGNGDTACLLRVILEVSLNILVGMVADNLDGVFVCADCTVAAETPELALDSTLCRGVRSGLFSKREIGNVIGDTDCEVVLRSVLFEFLIYSEYA